MSWQPGHATIRDLIKRGHLEQISGQAADGTYLVSQARQRITTAQTIVEADRNLPMTAPLQLKFGRCWPVVPG